MKVLGTGCRRIQKNTIPTLISFLVCGPGGGALSFLFLSPNTFETWKRRDKIRFAIPYCSRRNNAGIRFCVESLQETFESL